MFGGWTSVWLSVEITDNESGISTWIRCKRVLKCASLYPCVAYSLWATQSLCPTDDTCPFICALYSIAGWQLPLFEVCFVTSLLVDLWFSHHSLIKYFSKWSLGKLWMLIYSAGFLCLLISMMFFKKLKIELYPEPPGDHPITKLCVRTLMPFKTD